MLHGTDRIQDFIRQASSLNMVNTSYSIGLAVLLAFFFQVDTPDSKGYLFLFYSSFILCAAFVMKFMMQFVPGTRDFIKEEEFELVIAALNTATTFLISFSVKYSLSFSPAYIDFMHAFVPTLLFILITPLTWRKKNKVYVGIFGFLEWGILISVSFWSGTILMHLFQGERWELLFSNFIVFLSPIIIKTLGKRHVDMLTERMHKEIYIDPLTKISNRKCFYDDYDKLREKNKSVELGHDGLAMFFIDIDHFKKYNDYYGHDKGDECLYNVSSYLSNISKKLALNLYRVGGEEFLMCGPVNINEWDAIIKNEIIVSWEKGEMKLPYEHKKSPLGVLTLSGGLSFIEKEKIYSLNAVGVSKQADICLFEAKESGRGKLVIDKCSNA